MRLTLRWICMVLVLTFGFQVVGTDAACAVSMEASLMLPPAGTLMAPSKPFSLPALKAIAIDPQDPFQINFIVDAPEGNSAQQEQINVLIKYFLSFLALPEEDLWVNLSPYEKGRIIPSDFEGTNAGRDMLEQDYILKQLASSLTYPNRQLGRLFWQRVFDRARSEYGSTNVPINTFNKVWVVPQKAVVYEENGSAYIAESRLKVLVEEDYLSQKENSRLRSARDPKADYLSTQLTRELIVPELEKEVNEGRYFASLRQMFDALVLAIWFKKRLKEHLINGVYADRKKTSGIRLHEQRIKERIYAQYLRALKKGAYNFIREDYDAGLHQVVPRKYFSGGFSFAEAGQTIDFLPASRIMDLPEGQRCFGSNSAQLTVRLDPIGVSRKMLLSLWAGMMLAAGTVGAHGQSISLASGINPDLGTFKAKISAESKQLHDQFMHGEIKQGAYQMRWAKISYEKKQLARLEKQWQHESVKPAVFQPSPELTPGIALNPREPVLSTDLTAPPSPQPPASVAPPAPQPAVTSPQVSPSSTVNPSAAGPVSAMTREIATAPAATLPDLTQTNQGPAYVISEKAAAIPVEDHLLASANGIVHGLNPDKKDYQQGQVIFALNDPGLEARIDGLAAEQRIRQQQLDDIKQLFDRQAATLEEIVTARQKLQETAAKLAKARQEGITLNVIAPHDLTIKDMVVTEGMPVSKNQDLLAYFDKQRVRLNFTLPASLNYLNDVREVTLNGQPLTSILSVDWSFDPLQKNAQASLVGICTHPPFGQVDLKAAFGPAPTSDANLNSATHGAETIASVRQVEQFVLRAPAQGRVRFLVHEGQQVGAGRVVAVLDNEALRKEYQSTHLGLQAVDIQIAQALNPDGTLMVKREALDNLKIQRANLMAQLNSLAAQIERLNIRAPQSGIVHSLVYESKVFAAQDEILRIGTGHALIGDVNDMRNPVLFPQSININAQDPVVVQTPQGLRLPGYVLEINPNPYSSTMNLSGYQAVQVMAVDLHNVLQPGLPVRVMLADDHNRQAVQKLLAALSKQTDGPKASGAPPPDQQGNDLFPAHRTNSLMPANFNVPASAASNASLNLGITNGLTLTQVADLVGKNQLVTGTQALEVLQKQQEEAFPKASRFSLNGGVYMKDGKLFFDGGVKGIFNNMVGGSIQSGNAISAAVPVVYQLLGDVVSVVSGKVHKEVRLAQKATETAVYHMETIVAGQVEQAQDWLVNIGADTQKIDDWKRVLEEMEKAREQMQARQASGLSVKLEGEQFDLSIQDIKSRLLELESHRRNAITELNYYITQSRTNVTFNASLSAVLPWGKNFTGIDQSTESSMRQALMATRTTNPWIKEAAALDESVDLRVKLQKLAKLPSLQMSEIYVTGSSAADALHNVSMNEYNQRTSFVGQGNNTGVQLELPVFDTSIKTAAKIMTLQKQSSQLNLDQVRAGQLRSFEQRVEEINALSRQIEGTEAAWKKAVSVWQTKAGRPDMFLPYQWIDERMEVNKQWQALIDLKAKYFKAEADLRKMTLMGQETSEQSPMAGRLSQEIASAVSGRQLPQWSGLPQLPSLNIVEAQAQEPSSNTVAQTLRPGVIQYHLGEDVSASWALMDNGPSNSQAGPLAGIRKILQQDPNIFLRAQALRHLLNEYKNDPGFLPALKSLAVNSTHPDVLWGIFKYMEAQDNHGLPFL